MADHIDNLIMEHLRAIRADIGNIREVKHRLASLESGMAGVRRENAALYETAAVQHSN